MSEQESLTATLVLLLDAARPAKGELAKALKTALDADPVTNNAWWQFYRDVQDLSGEVVMYSISAGGIEKRIDSDDDQYIGTQEQLIDTMNEISSSFANHMGNDPYEGLEDEIIDDLRKQGLITARDTDKGEPSDV